MVLILVEFVSLRIVYPPISQEFPGKPQGSPGNNLAMNVPCRPHLSSRAQVRVLTRNLLVSNVFRGPGEDYLSADLVAGARDAGNGRPLAMAKLQCRHMTYKRSSQARATTVFISILQIPGGGAIAPGTTVHRNSST